MSLHQHELYQPKDFTEEEYQRRNQLAVMVIDGGLGICKRCGAGEVELETWVTCEAYRAHCRSQRPQLTAEDADLAARRASGHATS